MNITNTINQSGSATSVAKIRAAVAAYKAIETRKWVLWEELKDELRKLGKELPDAVTLTEFGDCHLRVESKLSPQSSDVWFIGKSHYLVSDFGSEGSGYGLDDLGDLRYKVDPHGVASLSPCAGLYWTPARLAFLIVHRIASGARFVDPDA